MEALSNLKLNIKPTAWWNIFFSFILLSISVSVPIIAFSSYQSVITSYCISSNKWYKNLMVNLSKCRIKEKGMLLI